MLWRQMKKSTVAQPTVQRRSGTRKCAAQAQSPIAPKRQPSRIAAAGLEPGAKAWDQEAKGCGVHAGLPSFEAPALQASMRAALMKYRRSASIRCKPGFFLSPYASFRMKLSQHPVSAAISGHRCGPATFKCRRNSSMIGSTTALNPVCGIKASPL